MKMQPSTGLRGSSLPSKTPSPPGSEREEGEETVRRTHWYLVVHKCAFDDKELDGVLVKKRELKMYLDGSTLIEPYRIYPEDLVYAIQNGVSARIVKASGGKMLVIHIVE
jgi:hypothetical protein